MKSKKNKLLGIAFSNMMMQSILYAAIMLLCAANAYAKTTWTTITVDSVKINGSTLLGKQSINSSNGRYFFEYYIIELKAKCDSIEKSKLPFGIGEPSPLWKNFWLTSAESKKHINIIDSLFENNKKNSTQKQMNAHIDLLVDEDGSCYCVRVHSRVKLTDFVSASELIQIIYQIGTFKYTTPLVKKPEHGWYEFDY